MSTKAVAVFIILICFKISEQKVLKNIKQFEGCRVLEPSNFNYYINRLSLRPGWISLFTNLKKPRIEINDSRYGFTSIRIGKYSKI